MAFELDYDIKQSDDKKKLLLVDSSKYHESIDPLLTQVNVRLCTYLDVFGERVVEYKEVPFSFQEGSTYGEGTVIEINASDINEDGSDLLQDNIYDVILILSSPGSLYVADADNLTDFITEYEEQDIFGVYDYVKVGDTYYAVPGIPPGSAVEDDFTEIVDLVTDYFESKNNVEGVYPLSRWFVDYYLNTLSLCSLSNKEAELGVIYDCAMRMLLSNTDFGDSEKVGTILKFFFPLVNELMIDQE